MNGKAPGSVGLVKSAGRGVADTRRTFHAASAASVQPARSPTRRSLLAVARGDGAEAEADPDVWSLVEVAQAATIRIPIAGNRDWALTGHSVEGGKSGQRACGSCGRSLWSGRRSRRRRTGRWGRPGPRPGRRAARAPW